MRPPAPCSSSRCVLATFQPLFSPPMSENAGTRTLSKKTVFFTPLSVPPSPPVPMSSIGCTVEARQVRVDHEPGEVLVAAAVRDPCTR